MVIPEGKERRFVTLTHEEWEYLEKRIAYEKQKHWTLRKKVLSLLAQFYLS